MYLFKVLTQFFTGSPAAKVPEPAPAKVEEVNNKPLVQESVSVPVEESKPVVAKASKPRTTKPRGPGKPKKQPVK